MGAVKRVKSVTFRIGEIVEVLILIRFAVYGVG
jgi:hypothetical protein